MRLNDFLLDEESTPYVDSVDVKKGETKAPFI